jgi:multidrug resistance efflux pump
MSTPRYQGRRGGIPRFAFALAAVALVAAGLWWWSKRDAAAAEGQYRTARVERGDIRVAISSTGTLSAISTVTVGSQISGQVTEVRVDFNSPVKKGEVLARRRPRCARRRPPWSMRISTTGARRVWATSSWWRRRTSTWRAPRAIRRRRR